MRRSVLAIVAGLVLAVLGAALVATILAVPLAEPVDGELPVWRLLRTVLPIAAFALPGALIAIWLAEIRRVRGLAYWMFIGALLGAIGYLTLTFVPWPKQETFRTARTLMTLLAGGALGGWIYWWMAGRYSGGLVADMERAGRADNLDDEGLRRRCRACTVVMLLLGLLPLGLIGWHLTDKPLTPLPQALKERAEMDGTKSLAAAGLPWAAFKIEDHVGRVGGTAPDAAARMAAFEQAKAVLVPMTGLPGVVAYLQNDIAIAEAPSTLEPAVVPDGAADASVRAKALDDERLAAEAKRKAEDEAATAAAKAKALEEERLAAEAKRKAEDEAATAAAKAKALEEERLAAEAKRKAEDEAATAAAKAKALEEDRLAAEAKRKADEAKRLALEAEAERNAVAAARKADADRAAAQASGEVKPEASPQSPAPVSDPSCDSDFAETFKSTDIRFPLNGIALDPNLGSFFDRIAALAKRCASYSLDIAGHADRTGGDAINLQTSLARAVAMRDALIARGIAVTRLNARGYGDSRPLDPSQNKSAFKRNRRVELSAILSPSAAVSAGGPVEAETARRKPVTLPAAACNSRLSWALRQSKIHFAENSARVAARYENALQTVARVVSRCPNHVLVINGHTDRRGSPDANQKLSDARAHAIRNALMERGVSSVQLSAIGHGGLMPIAQASTDAAFARNRRVDFDVTVSAPPQQ